ncbi:MAG TPA: N-acetyltransferase [Rhodoblastus sp.]|nr:N-acetyltransferase [Rhodoblastus sp.]
MTSVLSSALVRAAPAFAIEAERASDVFAREKLLDAAMGPGRFRKSSQRLRDGRLPALALVARDESGCLVGTVRLWHVEAGGVPALLLGPLAVAEDRRCDGIGAKLMREAIARATQAGHGAILLVGDAPYYARFGFARRHAEKLQMPGPVELDRFLGLELREGALREARGRLRATGARETASPAQRRRAA